MTPPRAVVVVGESVAGTTAARNLRALGHSGPITIVGAEAQGACSRPPLSKGVLKGGGSDSTLGYDLGGLDVDVLRSPATDLDTDHKLVRTENGRVLGYDALIVATGADARRIAAPGQEGEVVLRTLDDARLLRARLDTAASALVVGAGFLGMEVVSACVARGIPVTVVDVDPPLRRVLGPFLSDAITARAAEHGVRVRTTPGRVTLTGDPVDGVRLPDGTVHRADLVVSCCGDVPNTGWLAGTGLAGPLGIGIDPRCATAVPGVFAAGDVTCLRTDAGVLQPRRPFWSNAVAQGNVAAASVLGLDPAGPPLDDYFWTEVLGLSIKVVGPLPLPGPPTRVEGDLSSGSALLTWHREGARSTVVAYGMRKPVPKLRLMAAAAL
ncbi:NAD(P)/FAD-dependent oxidoreductase [Saccharothrix variisporea]|uniref:NADPH-dependent 2,4-dienoyl-CoA reductase/sulfur reductase-like enzyme n=1 Tax=Saccharothrix variisporea TaxID=543527 RepID=A0A495XPD0_9PSEU|nr:NAD(P)/FAD-dependent oxidoreductase [Saccharothrix variisporea]RKT74754.1 NADPH-dependent 2,4-dienoyl-CoA reductase/sulfur reductase-like enzyme [Saccharothrix variisporea]